MKRALVFVSLLVVGCVNPNLASSRQSFDTPRMMEKSMLAGKSSGICATYEKMFKYAGSTGKKEDMDFARAFFTYSANDLGKTPQGFLDFCKEAFETSSRMQSVIDKYK